MAVRRSVLILSSLIALLLLRQSFIPREAATSGLIEKVALRETLLRKQCESELKKVREDPKSDQETIAPCEQKVKSNEEVEEHDNIKTKQEDSLPYLIFSIPTVPRSGNQKYLKRVLQTFDDELTGLYRSNVKVHVMNMRAGEHSLFDEMKEKYSSESWIVFSENDSPHSIDDSKPIPKVSPQRKQEKPNSKVMRQTLDVVSLLESVATKSKYVMLYEDDFELCPGAMTAIHYFIEKANRYNPHWAGIRCSFGLNGIVLQNTDPHQDVLYFKSYLLRHYARRPPDHLVVEWYAGEISESKKYISDRKVMAFRHNIANHIGSKSTLRSSKHWSFPGCFEELIAPQVFEVEAWDPSKCPKDDIWPCDYESSSPSTIKWLPVETD